MGLAGGRIPATSQPGTCIDQQLAIDAEQRGGLAYDFQFSPGQSCFCRTSSIPAKTENRKPDPCGKPVRSLIPTRDAPLVCKDEGSAREQVDIKILATRLLGSRWCGNCRVEQWLGIAVEFFLDVAIDRVE